MRHVRKSCIVVGLGTFGRSICEELTRLGHEVLAVDMNVHKVEDVRDIVSQSVCLDATEERDLKTLGLNQFDIGVVAIGSSIQSSILAAVNLKEFDVPTVWAKAETPHHRLLLERLSIDHIVLPEVDMGVRIAQNMVSSSFVDRIGLSNQYSIAELVADRQIAKKTIGELALKKRYQLNLVALQTKDHLNVTPMVDDPVSEGDLLIVLGRDEDIARFQEAEFA
ncbi:TrkA family potassium uptake protein [Shouchella sp. 1P09AA]|uniref:potassium channel family protein n=1 Tax=unclassified Shouchella TaxID=2893065 RepID=UPI0039A2FD34